MSGWDDLLKRWKVEKRELIRTVKDAGLHEATIPVEHKPENINQYQVIEEAEELEELADRFEELKNSGDGFDYHILVKHKAG